MQRWHTGIVAVAAAAFAAADGRAQGPDFREEVLKLNAVTGDEALAEKYQELQKDLGQARGLVEAAREVLEEARKANEDPPLNYNAGVILGRLAARVQRLDLARDLIGLSYDRAKQLGSDAKVRSVFEFLFRLRMADRDYAGAVNLCKDVLERLSDGAGDAQDRTTSVIARMFMAEALARSGKADQAVEEIEEVEELTGGPWIVLRTKGLVLREAGKYQDALDAYLDALEGLRDADVADEDVKQSEENAIRHSLSGVYTDMKRLDDAAAQLQLLINREPENPTWPNDLGYVWAENDMKLDEAEELIRKAIDLDKKRKEEEKLGLPPEAAYLDSLGWVLFKKKQYEEAVKYLEQALEQEEGRSTEILHHLGDAYAAKGEKDKAVEAYERALKVTPLDRGEREQRPEIEAKLKKLRGE